MKSITITGKYAEGLKESGSFTCLPWVKEQFQSKLGIDPFPGTFNLEVFPPEDFAKLRELKKHKGIAIIPGETGFCPAKAFNVLVGGKIKGSLIIPLVPDYPESKLEIISTEKITGVLNLKAGDLVQIQIYLTSPPA